MDKGFRKIAITLMGLTALSVILVGVYLWYNFNSRSNLVLVVPENSDWYIHVQTKEWLKEFQDAKKPRELMEFEAKAKAYPIFRGINSPKEVGISPHSDWIFFGKHGASFLALSVFSESALQLYCQRLVDSGWLQPPVKSDLCTRYKIAGKNAYIAFKHKAAVIGIMPDTIENAPIVQWVFQDIFSGKTSRFMENSEIQSLYEKGEALVAWKSKKWATSYNLEPGNYFLFPFNQSLSGGFNNQQFQISLTQSAALPAYWNTFAHTDSQDIRPAWVGIPPSVSSNKALASLLSSIQLTIHRFSDIGATK